MGKLTAARARSLLRYNKQSGEFTWREHRGGMALAGSRAGSLNENGYIHLMVDGRMYKAHRLAVLMVTGKWPTKQVDHRNRKTADNRWSNLRHATRRQNSYNAGLRADSRTGFKGVKYRPDRQRYIARITDPSGKRVQVGGDCLTAEQAAAAYAAAARHFHGEFARVA